MGRSIFHIWKEKIFNSEENCTKQFNIYLVLNQNQIISQIIILLVNHMIPNMYPIMEKDMEPIPILFMSKKNHQVMKTKNAKGYLLITKAMMNSGLTRVCIDTMLIFKVGITKRWKI